MTKLTFYKTIYGLSFVTVLFVAVLANVSINHHKQAQRSITQTQPVLSTIATAGEEKTQDLRINTFRYFQYILDDKEETLKNKLINRYSLATEVAEQYAKVIAKVSDTYNIPSDLLAALIRTESNYFAKAVSHKNAIGPAQIIAKYWKDECPEDLFDVDNNIQCAGLILTQYKSMCRNDWACTLQMYNVGPGNYRKNKYYQQAGIRYITRINKNLERLNTKTI